MSTAPILAAPSKNFIEKAYDSVSHFLDRHPALYKTVLVACHFFRTAAMYGMMVVMPTPLPVSMGVMFGGSLLYRASVERFCCFRFALPSFVGAVALWMAKASTIQILSGRAFHTIGSAVLSTAGLLPLVGYTVWVCYQSHVDIEKRMEKINPEPEQKSCCECV